jgi:hypothetical protein
MPQMNARPCATRKIWCIGSSASPTADSKGVLLDEAVHELGVVDELHGAGDAQGPCSGEVAVVGRAGNHTRWLRYPCSARVMPVVSSPRITVSPSTSSAGDDVRNELSHSS